jgi:uncharacterized protein (DUF1684 family)
MEGTRRRRHRPTGAFAAIALALVGDTASALADQGAVSGADSAYVAEIEAWHAERIERLRDPESWLSLTGLFWLEEGENLFGARSTLPITLPEGKAPPLAGMLVLSDGDVEIRVADGVEIVCDGEAVLERRLLSDAAGPAGPTICELGPLRFYVIYRGGRLALRVKDREHPSFAAFEGIERYPVDPAWRVPARFEPYDPWKPIAVPDFTGFVNEAETPGALVFSIDGREHRLDVLSAEDGFFVVFGDETNGRSTYGGGRFLLVDPAAEDGSIHIDFNTAYNPPCAFTPYATCPLPSEGNHLPIAVEAGEKSYGDH